MEKPHLNEILIEFNDIIHELKRVFKEGATELEYHNLCSRMTTNLNDENNIDETDKDTYINLKEDILTMHEYPLDYSFDYGGRGVSYIRFGIVFKGK